LKPTSPALAAGRGGRGSGETVASPGSESAVREFDRFVPTGLWRAQLAPRFVVFVRPARRGRRWARTKAGGREPDTLVAPVSQTKAFSISAHPSADSLRSRSATSRKKRGGSWRRPLCAGTSGGAVDPVGPYPRQTSSSSAAESMLGIQLFSRAPIKVLADHPIVCFTHQTIARALRPWVLPPGMRPAVPPAPPNLGLPGGIEFPLNASSARPERKLTCITLPHIS